jgi:type I restriction enzyme M protein
MVTRKLRELSEDDIMKIASSFRAYEAGTLKEEKGYCAIASLEDIAKQDYILTPGRYVGIADAEDDGEPFQEKMERLTAELSGLFEQSHDLEDEIRKQLASIGFTIK